MSNIQALTATARGRRQQGIALLVALIVLVVVTILGVAALRSALFQNRISVNTQMSTQAFQAAESGIDATMAFAAVQAAGPDEVAGTADDLSVNSPDFVLNQAVNQPDKPRRLCITRDGTEVDAVHGVRNADGSLGFSKACDPLPGAVTRVTTVISESPDPAALMEGFDIAAGAALAVQIRAEGEVPNTNVRTTHAEDWFRAGPGAGSD